MRDFGKVHTSYWTSSTVRGMSEDGRTLAIYLLTSPHGTIAGVFRLPDGYACDDLQWDVKRVQVAFDELQRHAFARRCGVTKWVWIINHFEWNPLENPNQKKSASKVASMVPGECQWVVEFFATCGAAFQLDGAPRRNPCGTVPQTLAEPFLNQEQYQEQYQYQETPTTSAPEPDIDQPTPAELPAAPPADADDVQRCPVGTLVDLYHELLPMNPRVKVVTESRKKAIRSRWKEAAHLSAQPFGYTTRSDGLAAWRRFFEVCAESAFLTGRAPSTVPGKPPFIATIDFIFSPSGFINTLENKYHREAA